MNERAYSAASQVLPLSGPVLKGKRLGLSIALRSCPAVLEKTSEKLVPELRFGLLNRFKR